MKRRIMVVSKPQSASELHAPNEEPHMGRFVLLFTPPQMPQYLVMMMLSSAKELLVVR
jgi:hypothetical protein